MTSPLETWPATARRLDAFDWPALAASLERDGAAILGGLLTPGECRALAALHDEGGLFRSRVVMARHGFGRGEYKYFANPLPPLVAGLRAALYPRLVPVANLWNERLGLDDRYPATLDEYLARCHAAGQAKPTPLLLRYGPGDYNCLHQDLYGECVFPLQATVLLSDPRVDFTGGDFILATQRPRMQSRADVAPLSLGDAVIFAVRHRPVEGSRGYYRVNTRHGVGTVRSGERRTLGLIFHDAA